MFAGPLQELISQLERLPGIGPKSAQRLAFYILRMPRDDVRLLSQSLVEARERIGFCKACQNVATGELCPICSNPRRDQSQICVVAEPMDIAAMERVHEFEGVYHVLHGVLDPLREVGPEHLKIRELLARIPHGVNEIILATNPTVEGDATALYLAKVLKPLDLTVTRLAHGMPVGGEMDYTDTATLAHALSNRRPV